MRRALAPLTVAAALACSGGEGGGADAGPDPAVQAALRGLPSAVFLPELAALQADAVALRGATAALEEDVSQENLQAAQAAWRAARVSWRETAAFTYGPVDDLRLGRSIEFLPVRIGAVEAELTGTATLSEDYVASLGATRKGFGVLEVLLFDPMGETEATLSLLQDARRRRYLAALGQDLLNQVGALHDAWSPAGDDYAATWREAAERDTHATLSLVVNELVEVAAWIEGDGLALPIGLLTGGEPRPTAVVGRLSANDRAELVGRVDGLAAVYVGGDPSLSDLTRGIDAGLDQLLLDDIARLRAAIEAIPRPLMVAVETDPEPAMVAFEAAELLFRHLAADLATAHGVTLTFSDNDGD